jgi:uncharacterized alkaline shock family protein YloU
MAVDHPDGDQPSNRLPCGRDLATLYEHLSTGALDAHVQACPGCRQAADAFTPVLQAVKILATQQPEPPAGFVESVMARIRADMRRTRYLALPAESPSTLDITEHAAAAIMSGAADTIPGVISRGCRFPIPHDPTHVAISISLRYGLHAATAADHIRTTLRTAARTQLGIRLRQIDVSIDDVHT